jgi:hypothetical protein
MGATYSEARSKAIEIGYIGYGTASWGLVSLARNASNTPIE